MAQVKCKSFEEEFDKLTLSLKSCTVEFILGMTCVSGYYAKIKALAPSPNFGLAWLGEARALAFGL
jgi:hypothetical protein